MRRKLGIIGLGEGKSILGGAALLADAPLLAELFGHARSLFNAPPRRPSSSVNARLEAIA
jgi:hypothetical protein